MPTDNQLPVVLFMDAPEDTLKMLRETLCVASTALGLSEAGGSRKDEHMERMQRMIAEIDRQRPLGADGKHGNLHTLVCGCDDKPIPIKRKRANRPTTQERIG